MHILDYIDAQIIYVKLKQAELSSKEAYAYEGDFPGISLAKGAYFQFITIRIE